MLEFRECEERDHSGILDCLRRNYEWMGKMSVKELEEWFHPMWNYNWMDESVLQNRSLRGNVLLDAGNIVGYFGTIYSVRKINGLDRTMLNLAFWAVDEVYRGRFIPYISDLFDSADYVTDFFPNLASVLMGKGLFKMRTLESTLLNMLPVPFDGYSELTYHFICDVSEIVDEEIRREYTDHRQYPGVSLVQLRLGAQTGYVFYKVYHDQGDWIRLLKIDNAVLFSEHAHEIAWSIFHKEIYQKHSIVQEAYSDILLRLYDGRKVCMECDRHFLKGNQLHYPAYKTKKIVRLVKNNCGDDYMPDHLYSLFVLFKDHV